MVRIKTISRDPQDFTRERSDDVIKYHKNVNPVYHPFEKGREYTRALNGVKLERVFAKPFIGALVGHREGIFSMARHPKSLISLASGACDGEIRIWHLPKRQTTWVAKAHTGIVRGLSMQPSEGNVLLSCSDDASIKLWKPDYETSEKFDENLLLRPQLLPDCVTSWLGKAPFTGIDFQWKSENFASASNVVHLWDLNRSTPKTTWEWGHGNVTSVKFNPVETNLLASTTMDRAVVFYDIRGNTPIRKLILAMKSNALAWNPMEAYHFTVANDDTNLYTFDVRNLQSAVRVHKGHLGAVLDIDFSPTGREFATASWDKTVRIYNSNESGCRDLYHLQRMQQLFSVKFSGDSKYIMTGSEDFNIRLWKASAAEPIRILNPREKQQLEYVNKLKERYRHLPELKRISRHKHLPKSLYVMNKQRNIQIGSARRKVDNEKANSGRRKIKVLPEVKRSIVSEQT